MPDPRRPTLIAVIALGALASGSRAGAGTSSFDDDDPAGDATPALRRTGKVVRVERAPSRTIRVPAGTSLLGMSPEDIDLAESVCHALHGTLQALSQAVCADFRTMADLMLTRDVYVSAFVLDRHEVTVAEYRSCVVDGTCPIDPLIAGDERHLGDDLPQVNISWAEARTFCGWRQGRLPTEAEWERAARGDDARRWPWGDQDRPGDWNHGKLPAEAMVAVKELKRDQLYDFADTDDSDGHAYAAPPGSYLWDEGPYGHHDLAGNVAEWVIDEYSLEGYLELGATNPVRGLDLGASVARVSRGGSWRDPQSFGWTFMRAPIGRFVTGVQRHPHVGFRCAYDAG